MNFEKKSIVLSPEDMTNFRSLLDQLNVSRHKCQEVMAPLLNRHGVDAELVGYLEFPELTTSLEKRGSEAGIMKDDLQRFRVFTAALRLVTKTADERGQELSEQMASLITHITSLAFVVEWQTGTAVTSLPQGLGQAKETAVHSCLSSGHMAVHMRKLRRNAASPPDPPRVKELEETLNETTRKFLEVVGEENKMEYAEMTFTGFTEIIINEEDFTDGDKEPSDRAVYDVRNYVIVRDLRDLMTRFQRDLSHLA